MREIVEQLVRWHDDDVPFALATVVRTFSSAPRGPGAAMAVSVTGDVVGSISGGCVESAVVDLAEMVLRAGVLYPQDGLIRPKVGLSLRPRGAS
ncbi:XdhC family protein [Rhodococcus sp. LB1]|uniref:XdhC family protein n=1 Tax=Rhodococcus sp. LB1 TaxID=1807499 RepID=UPI00077A8F43|nr:hypothetical protein AZG88_02360 [Rhodococcus sp. LB1]